MHFNLSGGSSMRKLLFVVFVFMMGIFISFGCTRDTGDEAKTSEEKMEKIKIGLSFSDFATERWTKERDIMTKMLQEKGYEVIAQGANHDPKTQNDQIEK